MESVKDYIYRFVPGPLFLIVAGVIGYEWLYKGTYWVLLGFIPITPLLILALIGLGIYLIKLGYIDGDIDKIKEFLHDKEES
ncbi:MAG: hypothetical protein J6Z11_01835 [Candidatus Riflebacteria bacterium]|nr:hypothetical protein [Candidatus Riflebacteria bacterium]